MSEIPTSKEQSLSLELFDSQRAEVAGLAVKYKDLSIGGVDDRKGYTEVDAARKYLKATRVRIQKTGKSIRDDAIAFQKKVIEVERGIIALIEPVERELEEKQAAIDAEKERIRRVAALPERKSRLESIGVTPWEEDLMGMDNVAFEEFYNRNYALYLKSEQDRLERDRKALEEEKERANRKLSTKIKDAFTPGKTAPEPKPSPETPGAWPKRLALYVHGSKDDTWEAAQKIGLSEQAYVEHFKYALSEVKAEILVQEDGRYEILNMAEA